MTVLSILMCVISLSGCMRNEPPSVVKIMPPLELLHCEPAPVYPGDKMTKKDLLRWQGDVWYAGEDCRSKLNSVKNFLDEGTPE